MDTEYKAILSVCVFVVFAIVVGVFRLMFTWAKKQKGAALAFGILVQMFLPDPKVEHTIEMVVETKRETKAEKRNASSDNEGKR